MDDFIVHSKLAAAIINDKHAHTAAAIGKRVIESRPQTTLINDRKTLLDVSSFGHCNNTAVITDVKDTVLLEDRP